MHFLRLMFSGKSGHIVIVTCSSPPESEATAGEVQMHSCRAVTATFILEKHREDLCEWTVTVM
jgi:hypothetical protein